MKNKSILLLIISCCSLLSLRADIDTGGVDKQIVRKKKIVHNFFDLLSEADVIFEVNALNVRNVKIKYINGKLDKEPLESLIKVCGERIPGKNIILFKKASGKWMNAGDLLVYPIIKQKGILIDLEERTIVTQRMIDEKINFRKKEEGQEKRRRGRKNRRRVSP